MGAAARQAQAAHCAKPTDEPLIAATRQIMAAAQAKKTKKQRAVSVVPGADVAAASALATAVAADLPDGLSFKSNKAALAAATAVQTFHTASVSPPSGSMPTSEVLSFSALRMSSKAPSKTSKVSAESAAAASASQPGIQRTQVVESADADRPVRSSVQSPTRSSSGRASIRSTQAVSHAASAKELTKCAFRPGHVPSASLAWNFPCTHLTSPPPMQSIFATHIGSHAAIRPVAGSSASATSPVSCSLAAAGEVCCGVRVKSQSKPAANASAVASTAPITALKVHANNVTRCKATGTAASAAATGTLCCSQQQVQGMGR